MATELYLSKWVGQRIDDFFSTNHSVYRVWAASQKLVSFMCGLGLVGRPEAGLSGLAGLSGDAGTSSGAAAGDVAGDAAVLRRGETGAWDRVGLTAGGGGGGAGLVGDVGAALRSEEDNDNGDDDTDEEVPGEWRAPGDTEKVVGVLSPNRASNSLHTAKLRLTPSDPAGVTNPEPATASEPLASSWQRSTKLPLRTAPPSLSRGRGLALWFEPELWL